MQLYGFASEEERDLFLHLISVSGVGPKVAIAILSGGTPRELRRAIASGDAKRFQAVPGIGKRTSERVIVELREKVAGELEEAVPIAAAPARRRRPEAARPRRPRRARLHARRGREPARGRRRRDARGPDRRGASPRGEGGGVDADLARPELRGAGRRSRSAIRRWRRSGSPGPTTSSTGRCARAGSPTSSTRSRSPAQLEVFIEAARRREEALDHVLLAGPPGLGKTSLAQIIAAELEAPFVQTAGPALERKADIASFLTSLEPGSVFFIDEIHRLNRAIEETLYPAMEDRQLPIVLGQGAGARTVTLDLPQFTLVGATTRAGLLTTPLRDRFGVSQRLEHYAPDDLARIVARSAGILGVEIDADGERVIAERSRGTPRVANRLLKRVRDFAEVRGSGAVTGAVADEALGLLEVDAAGLDRHDRTILETIAVKFSRRPGRALDARGGRRRGARDDRGRLRALPAPAGPAEANPARPRDHRARLRAPRPPGAGIAASLF